VKGELAAEADRRTSLTLYLRRVDRDRFHTVLLAPASAREPLLALYAFNYEIARIRETVSEPMLGRIRLQWWRESLAVAYDGGPVRHHPVVEALTATIRARGLTRTHFDGLVDAREADLDDTPPQTIADLERYAEATAAPLGYLALEILRVSDKVAQTAARHVAIAYALAGLLRAMSFQARAHRRLIPDETLRRTGLDERDYAELRSTPALRAAAAEIAATADRHLREARSRRTAVPRDALPALLPAVIAARALVRLRRSGHDPFAPALASPDPLQIWRLVAARLGRRF
jgi:phytoene synthase